MAVVIHGSFDEGPVVLALPPIYEFAPNTELDPIFSAWNRSSGITINSSQITDSNEFLTIDNLTDLPDITSTGNITALGDIIVGDDLVVTGDATIGGTITAGNLTGNNTGDQDLSGLVPYTGATSNVNTGTFTLNAERIYVNQETPIASTEVATKGYVDTKVFESTGEVTPIVAHNDTTGKEGGGDGHWFHLKPTDYNQVIVVVDTTTLATVTGLVMADAGINIVAGHQAAWIELAWNANVEASFDHYLVYYKPHASVLWVEAIAYSNSIRIEGLVPSIEYDFAVSAVNKSGNVTTKSEILTLNTVADSEAPATVSGLVATGAIQAVLLRWTHNVDVDFSHYHVYRNTTNDSATAVNIAKFKGNAFMDNGPIVPGTIGLTVDTTYYYWLKAVDFGGLESESFSAEAHATTRNIVASDIVNIGATQVIIQGEVTMASLFSPGVTTINGDNITTGTINLQKINFTSNGGIIANINLSETGEVQLDAKVFNITGATVFTAKEGGRYVSSTNPATLSRISIYPTTEIGLEITDDFGFNVLKAEIGGDNVGDLTIGNFAGGQGIFYDKSNDSTIFKGTIYASAGDISGVLSFGTQPGGVTGGNISLQYSDIWENTIAGDWGAVRINPRGYQNGFSYFRDLEVYDGKGLGIFAVRGSTQTVEVHGSIKMNMLGNDDGYLLLPQLSHSQRNAISKEFGMMVYDTNEKTICIVVNDNGNARWFKIDSRPAD